MVTVCGKTEKIQKNKQTLVNYVELITISSGELRNSKNARYIGIIYCVKQFLDPPPSQLDLELQHWPIKKLMVIVCSITEKIQKNKQTLVNYVEFITISSGESRILWVLGILVSFLGRIHLLFKVSIFEFPSSLDPELQHSTKV